LSNLSCDAPEQGAETKWMGKLPRETILLAKKVMGTREECQKILFAS